MPYPFFCSATKAISAPWRGSPRSSAPCPYLRKTFQVDKTVSRAHLHVTAFGLYECEINGLRVGDHVFSPGWTDYQKRIQVQEFDVTENLRPGENVLGAILGDGWYCGYVAWKDRENYGERPLFLVRLLIEYTDGSSLGVVSDETWKVTSGPIFSSDLLMGEIYDARSEIGSWSTPGYRDDTWGPVSTQALPKVDYSPSIGTPVRRMDKLVPQSIRSIGAWPRETVVIDFGQNFSGRIGITLTGRAGVTLRFRFAEMLNPDGTLYTENLRSATATDYYTCASGPAQWEPRFTIHGFRYLEIYGEKEVVDTLEVQGLVIYSDMPSSGTFACSHPLLSQLQQNILWGQKSNFIDIPLDCPQRDERLGWTGDAQVFFRTAAFNMNVQKFFAKWLRDLVDAQRPSGAIPPVVPEKDFVGLDDGGPGWSDAAIICPWLLYECYGDKETLSACYESMKRFLEYCRSCSINLIRSHPDLNCWGFGDWLALDGSGQNDGGTPKDLIGTAFFAHNARLMTKAAGVLGFEDEARTFETLEKDIVKAFQDRFLTPDGLLLGGTQTAHTLALRFDLLPDKVQEISVRELVKNIEKKEFHIGTGFLGTPYLLEVLAEHGHLDVAYRLLEQTTFPSWLFSVVNGATTIWERWDGWTPDKGFGDKRMNSFNHYAYGAVGAWLYRTVAGLRFHFDETSAQPKLLFAPCPGGTLEWAKASYQTAFGEASIHWKKTSDGCEAEMVVPENIEATFLNPVTRANVSLSAGKHSYSF